METMSRLFTGSNRLRLAAYTLGSLSVHPPAAGQPELESVAVAEAVLRDAYASSNRWFEAFAEVLADRRAVLEEPPPPAAVVNEVLRKAFEDVRDERRPDRVRTTLQMLWADELLESQSQMQKDLHASANLLARGRRRGVLI